MEMRNSQSIIRFLLLFLLLYCSFNMFGQSAQINKVWLEHGVVKNGDKGMTIHANIDVQGMKGKKIEGIAYFYNSEKQKLMGGLSGYRTRHGQVCASDFGTPSYDNSHFEDFDIFIPYESLPLLSGKHTYYILIDILDADSQDFLTDNRDYVSFTGTGGVQVRRQQGYNAYNDDDEDDDEGTIVCVLCKGQGEVKCWACVGGYVYRTTNFITFAYSKELCSLCNGAGTIDCPNCKGTGVVKKPTYENSNSGVIMAVPGGIYGGAPNNAGSGSSSGSTYRTCPSCGGSGTCSSCHGSGGEWRDTGYYTGSGSKSWISCPSCSGSKRCFNCHGSGRI